MSPRWRWFLPGYLLSLPHTLLGLALAVVYRSSSWRWSEGCLECIGGARSDGTTRILGRPGAQTHGWLIIYASERQAERSTLRVHERTHVVQGFLGGPLYVVAYSLSFLWLWIWDGCQDWHKAYRRIPFERQAYATADDPALETRWGAHG